MKKLSKEKEIELAQNFFSAVWNEVENCDDVTYDSLCEDEDDWDAYGEDQLIDKFNNDVVLEVLRLGFQQKYGVPFKYGRTTKEILEERGEPK